MPHKEVTSVPLPKGTGQTHEFSLSIPSLTHLFTPTSGRRNDFPDGWVKEHLKSTRSCLPRGKLRHQKLHKSCLLLSCSLGSNAPVLGTLPLCLLPQTILFLHQDLQLSLASLLGTDGQVSTGVWDEARLPLIQLSFPCIKLTLYFNPYLTTVVHYQLLRTRHVIIVPEQKPKLIILCTFHKVRAWPVVETRDATITLENCSWASTSGQYVGIGKKFMREKSGEGKEELLQM